MSRPPTRLGLENRWFALGLAAALYVGSAGAVPAPAPIRFLVPLAALVAVDAWGLVGGLVALAGAGAAAGLLAANGHVTTAALLAAFALGGAAAGACTRAGRGAFAALVAGALPPTLLGIALFASNLWGFRDGVVRGLDDVVAAWKTVGLLPPQVSNALPTMQDLWLHFYPTILSLAMLASSAAVCLVAAALLPRLGRPSVEYGLFRTWRMPYGLVWLLVLGLALVVVHRAPLLSIGANLTTVVATGYGFVGLAIVRYFLVAWGLSGGLQFLLLTACFAVALLSQVPLVPAFSVALGFLDTWVDFRGLSHAAAGVGPRSAKAQPRPRSGGPTAT